MLKEIESVARKVGDAVLNKDRKDVTIKPNDIWLTCEGITWFGWESLSIKYSLSQVQHSFEMKTTDISNLGDKQWNVKGGSEISIYFRNIRVFNGYVQKYDVSLSADSHEISIAGESKAIDLVQCSHVGKYFWKGVSGESIIKEVAKPFGIEVLIAKNVKLKPIPKEGLRVAVDSTAFDVIKKVAEQNSVLVYSMQSGTVCISDDPSFKRISELKPGDYTSISLTDDYSTIFSEVILKSQEKTYKAGQFKKRQQKQTVKKNTEKSEKTKEKSKTTNKIDHRRKENKKTKTVGEGKNKRVLRYRPLTVIGDGKETSQEELAQTINRRLNGDGKKVSLTVKTPYTPTGEIWEIGQYLALDDEIVGVKGSYIISDISFSLSESGFETQIDVCLPQVFNLKEMTPAQQRAESKGFFADLVGVFKKWSQDVF